MSKGSTHGGKGSKRRPGKNYADNYDTIFGKKNPVKKNMDKLHRPVTHPDASKYDRKSYKDSMAAHNDLNWDGN